MKQNASNGVISTELGPRRLPYSDTEINANTAEYNKGVELLNSEASGGTSGDNAGTRLWWDLFRFFRAVRPGIGFRRRVFPGKLVYLQSGRRGRCGVCALRTAPGRTAGLRTKPFLR